MPGRTPKSELKKACVDLDELLKNLDLNQNSVCLEKSSNPIKEKRCTTGDMLKVSYCSYCVAHSLLKLLCPMALSVVGSW